MFASPLWGGQRKRAERAWVGGGGGSAVPPPARIRFALLAGLPTRGRRTGGWHRRV